jgi:hypothetical protein
MCRICLGTSILSARRLLQGNNNAAKIKSKPPVIVFPAPVKNIEDCQRLVID